MSSGGLYCCNCVCWEDLDSERLSPGPNSGSHRKSGDRIQVSVLSMTWLSDEEKSEGQRGELLSKGRVREVNC